MNLVYKYFDSISSKRVSEIQTLISSSENSKIAFISEEMANETSSSAICYSDNIAVGICAIRKRLFSSTIYLFVHDKFTNKGIATNLLKLFIKQSSFKRVPLYLTTRTDIKYLVPYNLYLKNNFIPIYIFADKILLTHISIKPLAKYLVLVHFIIFSLLKAFIKKINSLYK